MAMYSDYHDGTFSHVQRMAQRKREMEYRARAEMMNRMMSVDMNGYTYSNGQQPSPHSCSKKSSAMNRKFHSGVIDYHRQRGVDIAKLESVCKEPACVLSRIIK